MNTKVLFRPSGLHEIMTNPRTKKEQFSKTCLNHLKSKMIEIKYGRFKEFDNKYVRKGKDCEEDSTTTYALIKNRMFEQSHERMTNDFLSGEYDLGWTNNRIVEAITDIKTSYNIHTFFDNLDEVKKPNYWQGVGYLHLVPTAQKYHIANVLTDNTDDAILLELHRESYKWEEGDVPTYREIEIIKEHIFTADHFEQFVKNRCHNLDEEAKRRYESFVEVPLNDRLIEHTFTREECKDDLEALETRIIECREYMAQTWNIKHVG